jgi:N utilization substance protein B
VSARRKARKRALDVLFAADIRGVDVAEVLSSEQARVHEDPKRFTDTDYATELIHGVVAHSETIDQALRDVATDWPLQRLATVDRAILRIGVFELNYRDDIPTAVAVSEAGELAAELSTDESRSFVQGVLGAVAKNLPLTEVERRVTAVDAPDAEVESQETAAETADTAVEE